MNFAFLIRQRLFVATLLAGLLLAQRSFALDPNKSVFQYICQSWSQQHGLPANGINAIAQSADGYLWLGAGRGLIRFDGVNFDLVGMAQTNGLRTTEVRSIAPSREGGLWFGLKLSAYGHYDGRGIWELTKEASSGTTWDVPFMMESKDGRLWIGGEKASVRSTNGEVKLLFPEITTRVFTTSGLEDSRGRIWLGTAQFGLFYMDQGKPVKYENALTDSIYPTALTEDKSGRIWTGGDLDLICIEAGRPPRKVQHPGGVITALLADRNGALWVGTFGNGLHRYYNGVWSSLKKTDGLGDDYVVSLAEDREGSLWVGTREGLSQLTDVKLPTHGIKDGLGWETALGVSTSPRGGVWVGTPVGAAYFDGHRFTEHVSTNSGLQNIYTKRALETRNGDLYVLSGHSEINIVSNGKYLTNHPTADMPVAMIEDEQGVIVSVGRYLFRVGRDYLVPYVFTNQTPDFYWIVNLARCEDGSILVACVNGIFKIKDGGYEHWTPADGLADNEGRWVFEDDDGTIWAGLTTGISRIRGREVRTIRRENGLLGANIWAMTPDDVGNIWVDSNDGIFSVKRRNLNDFADGNISRVTCVSFNEPPAIKPADKYGQEHSACRTPDGRIWFPSSRGLVMINPTNIPINRLSPPVHISRLRANGQDMTLTNGIRIPPGRGELEFHYDGLSYIVPQKTRFRYQLEGYDREVVEADNRKLAAYNNLKPGRYTFRVTAANTDGVWNKTGESITLELLPHFHQTAWFYLLCGALGLAALGGIYAWRVRHLTRRQLALQKARDLLEAEVASRTAELATANKSLQREEAQLKQRTELLEKEIEKRERMQLEIERVHRELLKTSRQAGMAEIATNVLHNVGNVLNSVNVSASLVTDGMKKSKASSLAKVVGLLREHEHDLGTFFASDPKGKQLPAYLNQLSEQLLTDQATAMQELNSLRSNIDHIKEIVTMQQTYARVSGVKEIINITELVEDSLRMNESALSRHRVEVVREFQNVPLMNVEKHKILQILVNLIRNSKHACQDSGRADKRLTLRVTNGDDRIKISITDNGVGIPAEDLTRIFSHGFTTKKDGHGFGLHSGALAAREMGGSLTVHSDGPGCGATFVLELPCEPPRAPHAITGNRDLKTPRPK